MKQNFITITGVNHYYGMTPFKIGMSVKLVKEPENQFDDEAVRVELPYIGTIGYVSNSANTVFAGTVSAGRLYDKFGEYTFAKVMFITHSSVIAVVGDSVTDDIGDCFNFETLASGQDCFSLRN